VPAFGTLRIDEFTTFLRCLLHLLP
jgi:hypothetical protein